MHTTRAKYSPKEAFYLPPPPCTLQTRDELTPNSSDETRHLCVRQAHLNAIVQIHSLNFGLLLITSQLKAVLFIQAFSLNLLQNLSNFSSCWKHDKLSFPACSDFMCHTHPIVAYAPLGELVPNRTAFSHTFVFYLTEQLCLLSPFLRF